MTKNLEKSLTFLEVLVIKVMIMKLIPRLKVNSLQLKLNLIPMRSWKTFTPMMKKKRKMKFQLHNKNLTLNQMWNNQNHPLRKRKVRESKLLLNNLQRKLLNPQLSPRKVLRKNKLMYLQKRLKEVLGSSKRKFKRNYQSKINPLVVYKTKRK